ncbi:MAG: glycosyltransferase, partial [Gemmatimonadaceae bacterium]|nr:glycosyltransferase [Gemmatimonadaceae bacterium]
MPECIGLLIESEGPGGAEYVVLNLAESLRARGHRVAPITLTHSREPLWIEAQFRDRGFDVDRAVVGPTIDPACLWHLRGVLKARGVDIVNSHEFGPAIYGTTASKLLGLPHVITMHGNMWVMQARRRRVALRWAIRASRATIAVSRDTHRHMTDQMGLGEREITTVLNGVPERVGERGVVRQEFGISDGDVLIVAVGNLIERKGHAVLVRAIAAIRSRRPDVPWRLLIAGEGVERPALEA